jgi:hypothetical protein
MGRVLLILTVLNGLIVIALPWAWLLGIEAPSPDAAVLVWTLHLLVAVGCGVGWSTVRESTG